MEVIWIFDALAYPDIIIIDGIEYKACKKIAALVFLTLMSLMLVLVMLSPKNQERDVELKVLDASFTPGATLEIGTDHPHMLTLTVENLTANQHKSKDSSSVVNIGNISGHQVQVGNNSQTTNISIQELVEKIAKSDDTEAKNALVKFLENSTVASVIGAGVSGLISLL